MATPKKKTKSPTTTAPAPSTPASHPDTLQAALDKTDLLKNYVGPTPPPFLIADGQVILLNPDVVLRKETNGNLGSALYEDMLKKDLSFAGLVELRLSTVLDLRIVIEAASQDPTHKRHADFVNACIAQIQNWDEFLENSYKKTMLTGRSFGELEWITRRGPLAGLPLYYGIQKIWSRNVDRFVFDIRSRPRLLIDALGYKSVPLHPRGFATWANRPTDENPYGYGWGEATYYLFVIKKNAVVFWSVLIDRFGSPTVVAKYKKGTKTADEQKRLQEFVEEIQNKTAVTLPDDIVLETLEAKRSGAFTTYSEFVQWVNAEISMRLLSHTGTNDTLQAPGIHVGPRNNSTQNRADSAIIARDARMLATFIRLQIVQPLIDVNFGTQMEYPKVTVRSARPADAATEIAVIAGLKAVGCGNEMGVSYTLERMGYPGKRPEGDTALGPASPTGAEVGQPVEEGGTPGVTGQPESVRQRQPGQPKKKALQDTLVDSLLTWAQTDPSSRPLPLEDHLRAVVSTWLETP